MDAAKVFLNLDPACCERRHEPWYPTSLVAALCKPWSKLLMRDYVSFKGLLAFIIFDQGSFENLLAQRSVLGVTRAPWRSRP